MPILFLMLFIDTSIRFQEFRFDTFTKVKNIIYFILILSLCNAFYACKNTADATTLQIAYNVLVDPSTNNYEIFVMGVDGENPINISNHQSLDWVYSAYADKLYAISDRDTCSQCYFLYETDSNGSNWKKINQQQIQDSWVSLRKKGSELIIKPVGAPNEPFQIIDHEGNLIATVDPQMDYFNDPCFSPDGTKIVFRGYNGDPSKYNEAELYSMTLQTKEVIKITSYPSNGKTFAQYQYYAGPPRWNQALGKITYSSSNNGHSLIKSLDPIGTPPKSLTQKNLQSVWHDISPEGRYLAFDGQLDYRADSTTSNIYIMDFEKRNAKKLTVGRGFKQGPVFIY